MRTKRVRRSVEASREAILETAQRHLVADGPEGVKVQRVARELGLTDAAVHYHFGSREGLLQALLRYCGRQFARQAESLIAENGAEGFDAARAANLLTELFATRGTARLAAHLMLTGWTPEGEGMFLPLARWLHETRARRARSEGSPAPQLEESQKVIAVLSAVAFSQALCGDALLRSVGLGNVPASGFARWLAGHLAPTG